jgi:ATP-binding cassette subfamily B protein
MTESANGLPAAEPDPANDLDSEPGRRLRVRVAIRHALLAGSLAMQAAPMTLALYVASTLATGVLPVVAAWLTKGVIDNLVRGADLNEVLVSAAGLTAAGVLAALLPRAIQFLNTVLDLEVGLHTQSGLFSAVDRFVGLGRFENPHFLDRLRLAQQAGSAAPGQVVDGALGLGRCGITVAGFLGSLYVLSPWMTALVLASAVPAVAAELLLSRRRARVSWSIGPVERREFFYGDLLTSVEAAKEVRLFGIGAFLQSRMLADRRFANAEKRALERREVVVQAALGLLAACVSGGGLLWAVTAAQDGRLSVGDIMIFVAAIAGVQGALAALAGEIARSHHALLMLDHYVAVTAAGCDLPVATVPREPTRLRCGIELRDVWFRYSDDHPWILRGVSLMIPCGKALAVVGLNGAGKSTLVKLLCRFYDPTRGSILWDDVDIRDLDPAAFRQRISAVFQDYMEYDMSAAENIGLGDLTALDDHDRIRAAAEQAGIHDKLMALPMRYETLLSRIFFMESDKDDPETGVVLSGGQWQRLALARALLREGRDLMILDEPSAGLDAEAEHEIHRSLRRHREGRTSLLISHRLGAVREADVIVVLADGEIVERGNHHTLMAATGEYARLFGLQAAGYQDVPSASDAEAVWATG